MKLWPIIPVTVSFMAGLLVAKSSHQESTSRTSQPTSTTSKITKGSLLTPRKGTKETRGVLPIPILKKVTFTSIVDGKITPITRHTLALTDAQCATVEAAIAEYDAAIQALDQKLGLQASIIEQTEEQTVINLPDDAEARYAIRSRQWERINETIGTTKTTRLIQGKPEFTPWWKLHRTLTLTPDGNASLLKATLSNGKRFNPQRSMQLANSIKSPWKEIVQRLDVQPSD